MSIAHFSAFAFAIFAIGGWFFVLIMHIVALLYGKYRLHRMLPQPSPEDLQGISIIKPLVGVDPNLYSNLETFFHLVYPAYELLFCVQDENDPAIMVVQKLIETYPKINAKLFIGITKVGVNGKINNMVKAYEAAKYDLLVISDSGIRSVKLDYFLWRNIFLYVLKKEVKEDTLMDMASFLKPDVGLVLQMPYSATRKGFAATYEKVFFGTWQSRNSLSANSVGINCSTGMSSLFRKDLIEEAGGLAQFGKYLAEDYFISKVITASGYKTVLCSQPAIQNSGYYTIGDFHKRLIRWSQLRGSLLPHLMFLEPLSECMLLGVVVSWAMEYMFGISPMGFFLLHVLMWFLADYTLLRIVENGPLPFSKFEFLVAWLLREVLAFYLTLQSHRNRSVKWRHKNYKVHWGGIIEEV